MYEVFAKFHFPNIAREAYILLIKVPVPLVTLLKGCNEDSVIKNFTVLSRVLRVQLLLVLGFRIVCTTYSWLVFG